MKKLVAITVAALFALIMLQQARKWAGPQSPTPAGTHLRVVSLAPHLTSILFEIGAGQMVVGVTTYCDDPPEAQSRELVGDFINPSFEKIVDLSPDLVLVEKWQSSKTADRLRSLGLEVVEFAMPVTVEGVFNLILEVAERVGVQDSAREQVAILQTRLSEIRRRASGLHAPSLYVEIDLPTWTVGSVSFTSDAIETAGARNLFSDLRRPASQVAEEVILRRNPEVILSFVVSAQEIARRPGWEAVTAVKKGQVIDDFDAALLSRASHRLIDGMEILQNRLLQMTVSQ